MAEPFKITYSPEAVEDLRLLRPFDRKKIIVTINQHLTYGPTRISRSRIKRFSQPFWCEYRLRIDNFRAYYNVDEATQDVSILRVLPKGMEQTPSEAP